MRVAHVGLEMDGAWGYLPTILAQPDVELVAIAERHADLRERAAGVVPPTVRLVPDLDGMLDTLRPDAVTVTAPANERVAIVRACARRGVHVEMQKPLAHTGPQAREIAGIVRESGIRLMCNWWPLWRPGERELRRRVQSGAIGPVQKLLTQNGHQGPAAHGCSSYYADYFYDPTRGGGTLFEHATYGVIWALLLLGRPSSVFAIAKQLKDDRVVPGIDDESVFVLDYPGATAICQGSWSWPGQKSEQQVYGAAGSLRLTTWLSERTQPDGPRLWDTQLLHRREMHEVPTAFPNGEPVELPTAPPEQSDGLAHFFHCLRSGEPFDEPHRPEMAVWACEVVDAGYESVRTGRAVPLVRE